MSVDKPASRIVGPDGLPLDEATLAYLFHPPDPALFDDPVCGAELRRLAAEDPDVIAAVADVDRSMIRDDLERAPGDCLRSAERTLNFALEARRVP
jgi:hypothetical protein